MQSVLGPDLILIMSHLIVKRAEDGLPVAWHQDNTYWPSVHGNDVGTVWMAIDDTDRENGCMQVIPCTHAGYPDMEKIQTDGKDLLGLTVRVTNEMKAAAIALEMQRRKPLDPRFLRPARQRCQHQRTTACCLYHALRQSEDRDG